MTGFREDQTNQVQLLNDDDDKKQKFVQNQRFYMGDEYQNSGVGRFFQENYFGLPLEPQGNGMPGS